MKDNPHQEANELDNSPTEIKDRASIFTKRTTKLFCGFLAIIILIGSYVFIVKQATTRVAVVDYNILLEHHPDYPRVQYLQSKLASLAYRDAVGTMDITKGQLLASPVIHGQLVNIYNHIIADNNQQILNARADAFQNALWESLQFDIAAEKNRIIKSYENVIFNDVLQLTNSNLLELTPERAGALKANLMQNREARQSELADVDIIYRQKLQEQVDYWKQQHAHEEYITKKEFAYPIVENLNIVLPEEQSSVSDIYIHNFAVDLEQKMYQAELDLLLQQIRTQYSEIISRYAKEHNYNVVLSNNKVSLLGTSIYFSPIMNKTDINNITYDIINIFNGNT